MDGFKIRAKLALNFPKPVGSAEAEQVMMQYARAFAASVECELSNGDLPFEEHELHQRITDQVQALPKKNVRLIGLHVWHKGAVSSRSMLAVKPDGKATVPAMPAVSQTREKAPSPSAHTAMTVKPDGPPDSFDTGEPELDEPTSRGAVTLPAPDATSRSAANAMRTATGSIPAMRAAKPSTGVASPGLMPSPSNRSTTNTTTAAAASRSTTQVNMPAVSARTATSANMPAAASRGSTSTHMPAAPRTNTSTHMPAAARMMSGVVPAVEPRILRAKSGFLAAFEQTSADSGDDVGRAMAQPVRDAAAGVLLATLDALHGAVPDPLSLFDGRADAELRRSLIGEACVCVCYVLYESLTRTSLAQMQAIQVVQSACVHALSDENMPVSEISRYLATESPREEFSARACLLLGVRETAELQQRVEACLRSLRIDVKTCAEQIESRLSRAKAASGR